MTIGTPEQLRASLTGPRTEIRLARVTEEMVAKLRDLIPNKIEITGNKLIIDVTDPDKENASIVSAVVSVGGQIQEVNQLVPTLEDVYLQIVRETK